ncbi:DUF3022 domain-containing protein [Trinickia caryophylli]|uniref:DUF3022 domain-containing protein n=1 Tax=Trinickia caryophylli TaxID=28094 RepID=A0A1X7EBG7_TRICW|nr:DUF3022 domain-containing protein [Trinickia caryophylli]WQE14546.1 DUF3022 domain-containing protein [Trinickia caryophylli]GLU32046.1 hypothetical protein Busp01_18880 [Trinickia caryophylli]SMF31075.1 Protein of unknown function [Trinickia caryophylli]
MTAALDVRPSVVEIEHALSKSFPYPSTAITHVTDSRGVVTIRVSWVASAATMSILDSRCALNLVFEPEATARYAALRGADRLRAREGLRTLAEDEVRAHLPTGDSDLTECNLTVGVRASTIDEAVRGRA